MSENLVKIKQMFEKRRDTLKKCFDLLGELDDELYFSTQMILISEAEELDMQIINLNTLLKKG